MSAMPLFDDFLLDPSVTFLNHGSFGATPKVVLEEYQRWQTESERQPVEFYQRRFDTLMNHARSVLAEYVHVPSESLIFMPNATVAMNMVAKSLALQAGDEILTTNHEYGAMNYMWQFIAKQTGAVYINQPLPYPLTTPEECVEAFWSAVTPKTKVIFLSHITSPTALILPIAPIIQKAREANILTIVDGAHAVGQIPLDLTALGADVYTSNCHKWLCAPKGSAFLVVRPAVQHLIHPLVISWGWLPESDFAYQNQWQGTRDIASFLSIPKAIEYQQAHNWEQVRAECHALAQYTRQAVGILTQLEPLSPDSPDWYGQMVALPLPKLENPAQFKQRLYDDFRIEAPITQLGNQDFVRVSYQAYNSLEDAEKFIHALRAMLEIHWFFA
jgi:isopenicillin-N epimerase